MTQFKITCIIDNTIAETIILFDKKNKSIHLHIYNELWNHKKSPINVKKIDVAYPMGENDAIVQQIMEEEMKNHSFKIEKVEKVNEIDFDRAFHPIRVIRRYS